MSRDRAPRHLLRPLHLVVVCTVALAVALWRVAAGDPLSDAFEERLLDLRFQLRGPGTPPAGVVLVAIDERTVDSLGWSPPPRDAIAGAIGRILDAGPAAVGLDLLFLEQIASGPTLAAALAGGDHVVLAAATTGRQAAAPARLAPELQMALERSTIAVVVEGAAAADDPARHLLLPGAGIVGGATLGHVNIVLSPDRVARHLPLGLEIGPGAFLPAMPLEVARLAEGIGRGQVVLAPGRFLMLGVRRIDTDAAGAVTINHYGGRGTIATVSLIDVIEGRVPAGVFAGRAVFVGATAESLGDLFATPYSAATPGAEIIATVAANLLGGDLIRHGLAARALTVGLALALAVLVWASMALRGRPAGFAAVGLVWGLGLLALQLAFARGQLWLDATAVIAALLFATGWTAAQRLRAERHLAATLTAERGNLAGYVSPVLAEHLASGTIAALDRRSQDAAVLFVDVAGYTALSEALHSADTAAFLHDLHRLFERCAARHRGVITAFIGDGAMIAFGLPEPTPGDAAAAISCGAALLGEAGRFSSAAVAPAGLALRISIHFGPVTTAILGGEHQAQVTVTGDTVNVASRLQETAKQHGSAFVVSRAALDAARATNPDAGAGLAPLPDQPVRGRKEGIAVLALLPDQSAA